MKHCPFAHTCLMCSTLRPVRPRGCLCVRCVLQCAFVLPVVCVLLRWKECMKHCVLAHASPCTPSRLSRPCHVLCVFVCVYMRRNKFLLLKLCRNTLFVKWYETLVLLPPAVCVRSITAGSVTFSTSTTSCTGPRADTICKAMLVYGCVFTDCT